MKKEPPHGEGRLNQWWSYLALLYSACIGWFALQHWGSDMQFALLLSLSAGILASGLADHPRLATRRVGPILRVVVAASFTLSAVLFVSWWITSA
jgi:fructose-specific phosphotransferase system IIC component